MASVKKSFIERVGLSCAAQQGTAKLDQAEPLPTKSAASLASNTESSTAATQRDGQEIIPPNRGDRMTVPKIPSTSSTANSNHLEHAHREQDIEEFPNKPNVTEPLLQDNVLDRLCFKENVILTGTIQERLEQAARQRDLWSSQHDTLSAIISAQDKDSTDVTARRQNRDVAKQRDIGGCEGCQKFGQLSRDLETISAAFISEYELLFIQHEELTAHCNRLLMQNSRSQPLDAAEENVKATQDFRKLNHNIRNWCLALKEFQPKEELKWSNFPLSKDSATFFVHKRDLSLSKACTWEWLLKGIFGTTHDQQRKPTVDLWTDTKTARCLKHLENRVEASQQHEAFLEWRSSMVQALAMGVDKYDNIRIQRLASQIVRWFLEIFGRIDFDSEPVQKLRQTLATQVIVPAITFQCFLRQCHSSILVDTPVTIEDAICKHRSIDKGFQPGLELIVEPELKKMDLETKDGKKPGETLLVQAFRHPITKIQQSEDTDKVEQEPIKDETKSALTVTFTSPSRYSSQSVPIFKRLTEPYGAVKSKGQRIRDLF